VQLLPSTHGLSTSELVGGSHFLKGKKHENVFDYRNDYDDG